MTRWSKDLDNAYFEWLIAPLDQYDTRLSLSQMRVLYSTAFEVAIAEDRNRAANGVELREEFLYFHPEFLGDPGIDNWLGLQCSVLEMLQALANCMAYTTSGDGALWVCDMLQNLDLGHTQAEAIEGLKRLNQRSYSQDGRGGLFPLRHPLEDQRTVPIWYQMSAYLIENDDWRDGA